MLYQYLFCYFRIKDKAKIKGKEASLLKVYVKIYGRRLFGAAILKLIGEMVAFIGPLAVGALTAYVMTLSSPTIKSDVSKTKHDGSSLYGNIFFYFCEHKIGTKSLVLWTGFWI